MPKRLLTIFTCIVIALTFLPTGYGRWAEYIQVSGSISTGEWVEKYLVYLDDGYVKIFTGETGKEEAIRVVDDAIRDGTASRGRVDAKLEGRTVYEAYPEAQVVDVQTSPEIEVVSSTSEREILDPQIDANPTSMQLDSQVKSSLLPIISDAPEKEKQAAPGSLGDGIASPALQPEVQGGQLSPVNADGSHTSTISRATPNTKEQTKSDHQITKDHPSAPSVGSAKQEVSPTCGTSVGP